MGILLDPKSSSGAVHLLYLLAVVVVALLLLLLLLFCSVSPRWQSLLTSTSAF
jgi:hypothetical protein